jgi:hypothetical protein
VPVQQLPRSHNKVSSDFVCDYYELGGVSRKDDAMTWRTIERKRMNAKETLIELASFAVQANHSSATV